MKEDKLQSDIVRKHSELYPKKRGQLFHVSNERNHVKQAYLAKAIGIVPGVADLLYFDQYKKVATELKVIGSRYTKISVIQQVQWGEIWEREGGVWRLCRTVKEAISCYEGMPKGLTISDVKKMLKEQKTKTIKF